MREGGRRWREQGQMNVAFSCDGRGWRERRGHCNETLPPIITGMEKGRKRLVSARYYKEDRLLQ